VKDLLFFSIRVIALMRWNSQPVKISFLALFARLLNIYILMVGVKMIYLHRLKLA